MNSDIFKIIINYITYNKIYHKELLSKTIQIKNILNLYKHTYHSSYAFIKNNKNLPFSIKNMKVILINYSLPKDIKKYLTFKYKISKYTKFELNMTYNEISSIIYRYIY